MSNQTNVSEVHPFPGRTLAVTVLGPLACLASCGGGSDSTLNPGTGDPPRQQPSSPLQLPLDPHGRGLVDDFGLTNAFYGRSVDLYGRAEDGSRDLLLEDVVVHPALGQDDSDFSLEQDAVSGEYRLIIEHERDSEELASAFVDEGPLPRIDANLPVLTGQGALDVIPRDASLVLQFNDWVDRSTLSPEAVGLWIGEADLIHPGRLLLDPARSVRIHHGGQWVETSTRVILETNVSFLAVEGDPTGRLRPTSGLPAASDSESSNLALRMSTAREQGRGALTNLAGRLLSHGGLPSAQGSNPHRMLRLRSGGPTSITGDPTQGFLGDNTAPRIVGTQLITITGVPQNLAQLTPRDFVIPSLSFLTPDCAQAPSRGDVIRQPGFVAVVARPAGPGMGGVLQDVVVKLVVGDPTAWPQAALGSGQYMAAFEASSDVPECFVQVTPLPTGFPSQPALGLSPASEFELRFNEAIAADSVVLYDSFRLTRGTNPQLASEVVVHEVSPLVDRTRFRVSPAVPLGHATSFSEEYALTISSELGAVTDLVGNSLEDGFQAVFELDAAAAAQSSGGRTLRFASVDEDAPFGNGAPLTEVSGQRLVDLSAEELRPRPVIRFDAVADSSSPLPGAMTPFAPGVNTVFEPFGAKLQHVWRHVDFGLDLSSNQDLNLDVEGINWAPVGGNVVQDHFDAFEIRLAHARRLPDESIDSDSLFPRHQNSGLRPMFDTNLLGGESSVVHPRDLGYTIDPADAFQASTGTILMPFPLNRNVEAGEERTYTWRDTALTQRAGGGGNGADVDRFFEVNGLFVPFEKTYPVSEVPSVALPLLMEFRTYPDANANGLNAMSVRLAANSSAQPYFRAFSSGGGNSGVIVNPDLEIQANGGFNPNSMPPGQPTFGRDNVFPVGSLDLVVRVSRAVTKWFEATDSQGQQLMNPRYVVAQAVAGDLPAGTSIDLDFRGALEVNGPEIANAEELDLYGDYYPSPTGRTEDAANPGVVFGPNGSAWTSEISDLDGLPYYQVRITFTSNLTTGETPSLGALAIGWQE